MMVKKGLVKSKSVKGAYVIVGYGRKLLVPTKKAGKEMIKAIIFSEKNRKEVSRNKGKR